MLYGNYTDQRRTKGAAEDAHVFNFLPKRRQYKSTHLLSCSHVQFSEDN
jgi:hypothetical protein